ncbi:MAG: hypothetical protein PHD95_00125 [Candidatus ainarchaeum sp.]|nr:hypothetical protein [Candidatus ainarchaeum sp.]
MLGVFAKGFKEIAKHPVCLVPGLAAAAVIAVVFFAVIDFFVELAINAVFLGNIPESGLGELPFQFFNLYAGSLVPLLLAGLVSLIVVTVTGFFYSNYAKELSEKKPSIGSAVSQTIEQGGRILSLILFEIVLAALIMVIFWILFLIMPSAGIWALVLVFLLAIAIVFVLVKLAFTIPAMACGGEKLKAAIGKSWEFSDKKFWTTVLFLIIVLIISGIIGFIGSVLSDLVVDEIAVGIIIAVFWAIQIAFVNFALAFYYLDRE